MRPAMLDSTGSPPAHSIACREADNHAALAKPLQGLAGTFTHYHEIGEELEILLARHGDALGISPDLPDTGADDIAGLLAYLRRINSTDGEHGAL